MPDRPSPMPAHPKVDGTPLLIGDAIEVHWPDSLGNDTRGVVRVGGITHDNEKGILIVSEDGDDYVIDEIVGRSSVPPTLALKDAIQAALEDVDHDGDEEVEVITALFEQVWWWDGKEQLEHPNTERHFPRPAWIPVYRLRLPEYDRPAPARVHLPNGQGRQPDVKTNGQGRQPVAKANSEKR